MIFLFVCFMGWLVIKMIVKTRAVLGKSQISNAQQLFHPLDYQKQRVF